MLAPVATAKTYRYLAQRAGSAYRELFVCGTSLRAQSLVSEMENEEWSPEKIAVAYHVPVEAVHEAIDYVHENEEFLAAERQRIREEAMAAGDL